MCCETNEGCKTPFEHIILASGQSDYCKIIITTINSIYIGTPIHFEPPKNNTKYNVIKNILTKLIAK